MRLAYLGPEGSNTEKAARILSEILGSEIEPLESIYSVFEAVESGSYGVVPSENSIEGSVTLTLDLLLRFEVKILGELSLPIEHCLIGHASGSIRTVLSHPQALAQCREYIRRHGWEAISTGSTSEAVKRVAGARDASMAAIGPKEAAELYGLRVLDENIQDHPNNKTRFILIGPSEASPPPNLGEPTKSSLFMELENVPGSLYRALGVFAKRNVNLSRIESRPSLKDLGYYIFYVDYERPEDEEGLLRDLLEHATFIKHLGSYSVLKSFKLAGV